MEGKGLLVTWHLYGSLPHALYPPPNKQNAGQAFVWMDRYLDSARGGPLYWKQQPIAQLVVDSNHYGAQHLRYHELEAFVVMANHVHLLVLPRVSPSRFLQTLKGYTAPEANRLLGRTASHSGRRNPTATWCATIGNRTASQGTLRILP